MGTVGKALELLDLFTRVRPQVGLSDIARLSGVNKATCHRLMTELQAYGLVEQVEPSREYRIGPAVLRLAALREETVPYKSIVQPVLADVTDRTGESAHVSMLVGGRVELISFAYAQRHGTRVILHDAETLPFHATSSGLAILAHGTAQLQKDVLAASLPALTPMTETDPARIRARLAAIRAEGFAESVGAFENDVHSIAAPVFASQGDCIGALAIAAPATRVTPDLRAQMIAEALRGANELTLKWGGRPPERAALAPIAAY
jgi:DNA-binding IclR family transcriptional regulator